jgi:DNA-binding beta-propeller fold protein YncE
MARKSKYILPIVLLLLLYTSTVSAAPYYSYTYSYWGEPVAAPYSYLPSEVIDGRTLGTDSFRSPEDIFVSSSGKVYILDSGNNRIVVLDSEFKLINIINSFNGDESFANPRGIFVTEAENIYVADTGNNRIIELDENGNFIRELGAPESDIIPESFVYYPNKLVVDRAGRIYVIAQNVNQGIMELSNTGEFQAYIGATLARFNVTDLRWRQFSTDEQRQRLKLFLPTEYNNIALDDRGFIYTTTSALTVWDIIWAVNQRSKGDYCAPVRKINPSGAGILRRMGAYPPVGDVKINLTGSINGQSTLTDVAYGGNGIYSVLDSKRGRVFTYDYDGNLMHIFGGIGNSEGTFRTPVALAYLGQKILVLDNGLNRVTVFDITEYGRMLTEAISLHYRGLYDESLQVWQELIKYNVNLDIVHVGLGKAYMDQDEFRLAMKHFKLGHEREYYSKAFKLYREQVIDRYFGLFVLLVLLVIFLLMKAKRYIINSQRAEVNR